MEVVIDQEIDGAKIVAVHYVEAPLRTAHEMQREAVRWIIERELQIPGGNYQHLPNGAPYLEHRPELRLSVSHTRGLVAVAFTHGDAIGIDVEQVSARVCRVIGRIAHPNEQSFLDMCDNNQIVCTALWTAKEAIYKALQESAINFDRHIVVNFSEPILPDTVNADNVIVYTANEYRTGNNQTYRLSTLALSSSNSFKSQSNISHLLTIAVTIQPKDRWLQLVPM